MKRNGGAADRRQARLDALVAQARTPGAVFAVLCDGEISEYASGIANAGTGAEMTADTLFPIASITKAYTATLVMQLVDEGIVGLDEPVRTYLPGFRVADPRVADVLTVRQLLTHTGGIDGDKEDTFGRGDDALERFVADCATLGQIHPPGATYSYCNSGFIVLGHLVSVLRGCTWDDAVRERLFEPLGAARSGTLPEDVIWQRVAAGHTAGEDGGPELLDIWENERAHGPAGGVVTSARQLLEFAGMHLAGGAAADGTRVLSPASAAAMATPQVTLPNPFEGDTHWGLGWGLARRDGQPYLIGHSGDLVGHHSRLVLCPERRFAAVLLTNGAGAERVDAALFREALAEIGVELPAPLIPPQLAPAVDLDAVAGSYRTLAVHATVAPAGDHLRATFRVVDPRIAALLPESDREHQVRFMPVTGSLYLTRRSDDDAWIPVVFARSGQDRYLHTAGRAMRRT